MEKRKRKTESRITIKDVAKAANVSIATVSYVLNDKPGQSISDDTRKKVLQFANLLGYECNVMAKYLVTGKSNAVAAIIKDIPPFAAQYYLKFLAELSRLLLRRNYELKLVDYDDGLNNSIMCDACITLSLSVADFKTFADTKYVPVIAVDTVFDDFLFYRINDDYAALCASARDGAKDAHIALLTHPLPNETLEVARNAFDSVAVVSDMTDITALDKNKKYVTVSSALYGWAHDAVDVSLNNASFALKASAAIDALAAALDRTKDNSFEHNIVV